MATPRREDPGTERTPAPPAEPTTPTTPTAGDRLGDAQASAPAPARGAAPAETRTGVAFNRLLAGAVILVLLLVFIVENTQRVKISYFGASGHLPLGVALLLAAVGGALLVGLVGAARQLRLRHRIRRTKR